VPKIISERCELVVKLRHINYCSGPGFFWDTLYIL